MIYHSSERGDAELRKQIAELGRKIIELSEGTKMATILSNPGLDDRWTCPACYVDLLTKRKGVHICSCGKTINCTLDTQPVCVAEIVDPAEYNEDD